MSNIGRLSTQDGKVGGSRIVATFLGLCNEIWSGSPATESIKFGLESGDSQERTDQQAEQDPAGSVDDDASAFGSELNFHDDTLAAANENQDTSETSSSDHPFKCINRPKKTSHKKMKDFTENMYLKKLKGSYQKNKKVEHQRSKSFRKN